MPDDTARPGDRAGYARRRACVGQSLRSGSPWMVAGPRRGLTLGDLGTAGLPLGRRRDPAYIPSAMPDTAQLYERDWYAWTQDQAARLRAWPEHLRPNGLDVEHLAEEVEDLGKSDRRAIESFLHQIVLHLLKLEFHPAAADARFHWMAEIDEFRLEVERRLEDSPSLCAQRSEIAERAWASAERAARRQLAREAPEAARRLDAALRASPAPRYEVDAQMLAEDWFPEAATG